ncbi:MAG: hypothetical protein NTU85_00380 [Candidatus Kaiserbacteria bacterium]|nr:hypothetical protein [Candidatus Kaiserbacteria bacterium]
MKSILLGILLVIIIGVGGFVYRNAIEHPSQPIACPMDAKICPDGTSVSREGLSCTFPTCPPPNVQLTDIGVVFALPAGFVPVSLPDSASVASYSMPIASSNDFNSISIRRYAIAASSTALSTIEQTAISGTSGTSISASSFSSAMFGTRRFTVVSIERFEGVIDTAYYLARGTDVLRFDAIDRGADWTNPNLDITILPAHAALIKLLSTLQGEY